VTSAISEAAKKLLARMATITRMISVQTLSIVICPQPLDRPEAASSGMGSKRSQGQPGTRHRPVGP
jgi:hypothetical protein